MHAAVVAAGLVAVTGQEDRMQDRVAAAAAAAERVALVAGATGLVGQAVLADLLTDRNYEAVHAVGRRPSTLKHPKLSNHVVNFATLTDLQGISRVDDVFIALGTTLKVAGSQRAFRAIDYDAIVAVAQAARVLGATKIGVISAMGADAGSRIFYNRVKGEMEEVVAKLGYRAVVIARPSLLEGDRQALEQPTRLGEKLGLFAMSLLKPLIPANYRAIEASQVAHALITTLHSTHQGTRVLLSGEMHT